MLASHGRWAAAICLLIAATASAQRPFTTDDTDVTPPRKFHLQFANEYDWLPRTSFPNLRQNTADVELDYGLMKRVEVGVELPMLVLFNSPTSSLRRAFGQGDMNLSVKYNFLQESKGSRLPALAINVNFELPTGDTRRQLGSGLADFYVNGIAQKALTDRTTLRLNGGILFSGNTLTGAVGLAARGVVGTGGMSITHQFRRNLELGVEITGAHTANFDLGKGQLQVLGGGHYLLREGFSLDFAVVKGHFEGSPRLGVQLGFSLDF
jgi:hypothetical protein